MSSSNPIFENIHLGIGTWSWGDRLFWGYGQGYRDDDLQNAFQATVEAGIRFFDTAEVYGQGRSETLLGQFIHATTRPTLIATKFMPYPWRLSRRQLLKALTGSLHRLQLPYVDLYQIHTPLPPISIEVWMEAMLQAVEKGLTRAVGVSNFDHFQMQRASDALLRQGVHLASNQVEYHLLNRKIEKNGLLQECKDQGITVIAYSPLAMGALTGKYSLDKPMNGIRGSRYPPQTLQRIQPLLNLMRDIGLEHESKTPAQVALNWIICKGALPIPGAKNISQADQNAGAVGWILSENEINALDEMSDRVSISN